MYTTVINIFNIFRIMYECTYRHTHMPMYEPVVHTHYVCVCVCVCMFKTVVTKPVSNVQEWHTKTIKMNITYQLHHFCYMYIFYTANVTHIFQ